MIDTILEPFVPDQPCPKCGYRMVTTRHWPDSSHPGCVVGRRLQTGRSGEHLERSCDRCGYRWEQRCVPVSTPEDHQDLLTAPERAAIDHLASFSRLLPEILGDGPTRPHDYAEIVHHVHVLQRTIGSQAAARAYPTEYRRLGMTINQPIPGSPGAIIDG